MLHIKSLHTAENFQQSRYLTVSEQYARLILLTHCRITLVCVCVCLRTYSACVCVSMCVCVCVCSLVPILSNIFVRSRATLKKIGETREDAMCVYECVCLCVCVYVSIAMCVHVMFNASGCNLAWPDLDPPRGEGLVKCYHTTFCSDCGSGMVSNGRVLIG